jgi:DNA polymerase III subunit delta
VSERRNSLQLGQLSQSLQKEEFRPVIVLSGEELFQVEEAVSLLRHFFLVTTEDRDFHYEILDGETLEADRFREACEMLPALLQPTRGARLVLCRRWEKADAVCQKSLEQYLENPSPSTCLVLTTAKIDRRKAWAKASESIGWVMDASEPFDRDWGKWQAYLEKKYAKKIAPDAWALLVELCGRKLSAVANEFLKLGTYAPDAVTFSEAEVWSVVASSQSGDIFKFAESVFAGRSFEALERYRLLMHTGESEIKLLAILLRHFRQLRQCWECLQQGVTDSRVLGAKLGMPPFFVPNLVASAKKYKPQVLEKSLHLLASADFSLKRGEGNLADLFVLPHLSAMRASL